MNHREGRVAEAFQAAPGPALAVVAPTAAESSAPAATAVEAARLALLRDLQLAFRKR